MAEQFLAVCTFSEEAVGRQQVTGRSLLATTWRQVRRHLPAVLAVAALSDGATFLLHRVSHRLTNTGTGGPQMLDIRSSIHDT